MHKRVICETDFSWVMWADDFGVLAALYPKFRNLSDEKRRFLCRVGFSVPTAATASRGGNRP